MDVQDKLKRAATTFNDKIGHLNPGLQWISLDDETAAKLLDLILGYSDLVKGKEFWHEQYRTEAARLMRAVGLPDDFQTSGIDDAHKRIAALVERERKLTEALRLFPFDKFEEEDMNDVDAASFVDNASAFWKAMQAAKPLVID